MYRMYRMYMMYRMYRMYRMYSLNPKSASVDSAEIFRRGRILIF